MNRLVKMVLVLVASGFVTAYAQEQRVLPVVPTQGVYEYEPKPDGEPFLKLNPRKAPAPGSLLLRKGDRVTIVGDSITEQRMYSRLIETYLVACLPELEITCRQLGWSGERTDGFLRRMDNDCLRFQPTVVTLCYGMNDTRYRPFDVTNGQWYTDHYTAIVQRLKTSGARVVVGSPGCSGKLATWVASRVGTLEEHNQHLCALRDLALMVAEREQVAFADIFWPMYQAQVTAPGRYPGDGTRRFEIAGKDGIHPDWAGHTLMAYAFLRALGVGGDLGTITVDLKSQSATGTDGHHVDQFTDGQVRVTSLRYPFCAPGPVDRDDSVRSGMTFVPFDQHLNRLTLQVVGVQGLATITWGGTSRTYSAAQLADGINLAAEFTQNPFCAPFQQVEEAVASKQAFETKQIKELFHGPAGRADMEQAVADSERERSALAAAVRAAVTPVHHVIEIR